MRIRTSRGITPRIDLDYFKRLHGLRRWRLFLSIAIPAIGVLWLAGMAAAGSRAPYSSGPLSSSHAFVESRCEVCHVADGGYRSHVGNAACLTCHDAPAHAGRQSGAPACATCHRDHQGRVRLAETADEFCVGCHGELTTTAGQRVASKVTRFPGGHPEFAAARPGTKDPGTLTFSHDAHLGEQLRGPSGTERLTCASCHHVESARVSDRRETLSQKMAPISYSRDCARCHPLSVDDRSDIPLPHDSPDALRAIERRSPPVDHLVLRRVCGYCHQLGPAAESTAAADRQPRAPLRIVPVGLTKEWLPRARFDHAPHLLLECGSCHAADESRTSADVLLPSEATCATCHAAGKGAESRCFECHAYHDEAKAHPVTPRYRLKDFK